MLWKRLLRSKFQGGIVGSAIGDALGAPFEGMSFKDLELEHWPLEMIDGRYTDDTEMMIRVAESLIEHKEFSRQDMVRRFIANLNSSRGYGLGPSGVLSWIEGDSWKKVSRKLFDGEGSYGNGAAVRITSLGLFYYDDPIMLKEACIESSRITHANELAVEGALVQAYAIALSVKELPCSRIDPFDILERIGGVVTHPLYQDKIRTVRRLLESPPDRGEIVKSLGNTVEAAKSVPTAIYCALKFESFESAVSYAIGLGGDTDTIAAMTGAISGTLHCVEDIPYRWRIRLENINYILDLADRLLRGKLVD